VSIKPQQTPEEEFAAAFKEAAAQRTAEAQPTPEPAASPAPIQQPEKPEPVQTSSQEAAKPEASSAAPQPDNEPAPAESEVDKLRRELEQSRHRERSASARVSAFHRKLNETTAELERLRKAPSAPAADAPAPNAPPAEEDKELQAALSEMPELGRLVDRLVAKKVTEAVGEVKQRVQQVEEGVKPLRVQHEEAAVRGELAVVEKEFPNWRDIVFSSEFETWIQSKPRAIQQAYEQAATGADGLEFLRMYHRDTAKPAAAGASNQPAQDDATTDKQRKQANLERAVSVPSRAAIAPVGGVPDANDFEAAFRYFASRRKA
jgi:chromosome segregation ATPase